MSETQRNYTCGYVLNFEDVLIIMDPKNRQFYQITVHWLQKPPRCFTNVESNIECVKKQYLCYNCKHLFDQYRV